ncbi:transcription factor SPT20 homolog [Nasonia vitripennis]|uniref:Uncharacterized protein n=1 Tax=Nasonia vitripennis TaxID=7425 RepID=A0A7M7H5A4_NASVI|nr:transcription factor SPT20 homolog [Nasonia vitripennis]
MTMCKDGTTPKYNESGPINGHNGTSEGTTESESSTSTTPEPEPLPFDLSSDSKLSFLDNNGFIKRKKSKRNKNVTAVQSNREADPQLHQLNEGQLQLPPAGDQQSNQPILEQSPLILRREQQPEQLIQQAHTPPIYLSLEELQLHLQAQPQPAQPLLPPHQLALEQSQMRLLVRPRPPNPLAQQLYPAQPLLQPNQLVLEQPQVRLLTGLRPTRPVPQHPQPTQPFLQPNHLVLEQPQMRLLARLQPTRPLPQQPQPAQPYLQPNQLVHEQPQLLRPDPQLAWPNPQHPQLQSEADMPLPSLFLPTRMLRNMGNSQLFQKIIRAPLPDPTTHTVLRPKPHLKIEIMYEGRNILDLRENLIPHPWQLQPALYRTETDNPIIRYVYNCGSFLVEGDPSINETSIVLWNRFWK